MKTFRKGPCNFKRDEKASTPRLKKLWRPGFLLTLLVTGLGCFCASAGAQTVFQDVFHGGLSSAWSLVRSNATYFTETSTGLVLRCNSGDLYQTDNNALNVFVASNPCPADFNVTVKLRWLTPPATAYAQFAVLAYDDDDNYVRAYYGDVPAGLGCYFAAESSAAYTGYGSAGTNFGTGDFWLQLQKRDFYYAMAFSPDGTNFTEVSPGALFSEGSPASLGFVAMVDPTETAEALVESFTVTAVPGPSPGPGQRFVPLNLFSVANGANTWLGGYPTGTVNLGGLPFLVLPSKVNNIWNSAVNTTIGAASTNSVSLPVQLYGTTAVDGLVNTGWGYAGATTVFMAFQCSDGTSFTNGFTAGADIRDWLQNIYENALTSTNTSQVYSSSQTSNPGKWGRIDKQHVVLPAAFASRWLTNIVLIDSGVTGNNDSTYSVSVHAQRAYWMGLTATASTVPSLTISAAPPTSMTLQVSWPTNAAGGWGLQWSTNLTSGSGWQNEAYSPGQPQVEGTNLVLTVTNTMVEPVRFYRLAPLF